MMTAKEANAATMTRLEVIAKEFILNDVGVPIQRAIDNGKFQVVVDFKKVRDNANKLGEEVVRQLKEQGYEAKHVYYDGPNGYDNYISIKWEKTDEVCN